MSMNFLEEIGVNIKDPAINSMEYPLEENVERSKKFEEQRDTYGFDERETWDLRYSSSCWIYQRLKMFKILASETIDLDIYSIDITPDNSSETEVRTLEGCIDFVIENLERYIRYENRDGIVESFSLNEDAEVREGLSRAFIVYGKIVNYLWW